MQRLEIAGLYLFLQLTVLFVDVYGGCPTVNGGLPTVPNGYLLDTNIISYSDGTVGGYYDISCQPGYSLNPDIGGHVTCLDSGAWSQPLPQCNFMGQCSVSTLFAYLENADGIVSNPSQSFIYTSVADSDQAFGGSNITVQCADGYINIGGPLTIVCTQGNSWTLFPICFSITTTTTTVAPPPRCPVTEDTWNFPDGYISNTQNIVVYGDNTAQGSLTVSCGPGYAIDPLSNGVYNCVSGTWSSRPFCTETARCSLSALQTLLTTPTATDGLQISDEGISMIPNEGDQVLIGSYILFSCINGYTNIDNNLNVVCNTNGQWSNFPSCIALSTTAAPGVFPSSTQFLGANGLPMMMNGGSKRKRRWIFKRH